MYTINRTCYSNPKNFKWKKEKKSILLQIQCQLLSGIKGAGIKGAEGVEGWLFAMKIYSCTQEKNRHNSMFKNG